MTLHQFSEYLANIHLFERLSTGEKPEDAEVYNESEIEDIARNHGINIPEK